MKAAERTIVLNLLRTFAKTLAADKGDVLLPETDCLLSPSGPMRRPDLSYFTWAQILDSDAGLEPVPAFVIELISKNDDVFHHEDKLDEYFRAGVQVVWHILPQHRRVRIYYTGSANHALVSGSNVATAAPVLPDFAISADALFCLPPRKLNL